MVKIKISKRNIFMKKVIIGIHGLGNKPPKSLLQKWWKDSIVEGFINASLSAKLPDFELIYWADILYDKPMNNREKDHKSIYFLDEPYTKAPDTSELKDHTFRKRVLKFISKYLKKILLNEDKTLNYSFLTGYIVKKYFKDLDIYYLDDCKDENNNLCKARELIRNRIADAINKYEDCEICIIAHSMGSIVAYDVLNYLLPNKKISTFITIGSPLGLPIVISKIAEEQKKLFCEKPILTTPPGITSNWFNLADLNDFVALNYRIEDDFSSNEYNVAPQDVLVRNNYHINGISNPHKSFGYLRAPEVSLILDEFIGNEDLSIGQKVVGKVQGFIQAVKTQHEILVDTLKQK